MDPKVAPNVMPILNYVNGLEFYYAIIFFYTINPLLWWAYVLIYIVLADPLVMLPSNAFIK